MDQNSAQRTYNETILDTMAEVAWVLDTQKQLKFVNNRISDILEIEPERIIGQHFLALLREHDLAPADKLDDYEAEVDAILKGERELCRFELPLDLKTGSIVIEIRTRPVKEDTRITGAVSVARDITQRIESEQELQQQNERLEEFASIVSHDLRNPLNVANGHLELAAQGCDSTHLDAVAQAHTRMETLIDDMLALATAGERVGDPEAVELSDVIESSWRNVETESATLVADTTGTIQADRSRLQQLLENLLRNAVEHGGSAVTVTVGELPGGFYVEDDGAGLPAEDRAEVFDAGYSTTAEGTGFGLSIVHDIAHAHGWGISATDGTAGGARFEITDATFTA